MKRQWHGEYRGIPFEIQNFPMYENRQGWTFYIYVREGQFQKEDFERFWLAPRYDEKDREHYDYMSAPPASLEWHCGITFYQKVSSPDAKIRCVKIGCDYQHYWDEGQMYNEIYLEQDAHTCIDSLYDLIGENKINHRCFWCGKWGREGFVQNGQSQLCPICHEKKVLESKLIPSSEGKS